MTSSERFTLRAAVYLILIKDGKVLLLRRFNTAWRNGDYTLPAGHVDGRESVRTALCREAAEEVGVTIQPSDLQFVHVMHQYDNHEYVDFYFAAAAWQGEPVNLEPEKCDDVSWFPLDALPENMVPNVRQALDAYAAKRYYSEYGLEAFADE